MKRIAIFASGAGTNAAKIIQYFALQKNRGVSIEVALIVCNKPNAGVLQIATENNISTLIIEKETFFRTDAYINELKNAQIDCIVLAGFLWKIPSQLVAAYPNSIINIHPALLPKYGGKGMYGNIVHQTVIDNKEKHSGITIHYVDELYDNGSIIFQAQCDVSENDTLETLATKVHFLEHTHYPRVIEEVILGK